MTALPKSGAAPCMATYSGKDNAGLACKNKASYEQNGRYLCGVHCRGERRRLPKTTRVEKREAQILSISQHLEKLTLTAQTAKGLGQQGRVKLFQTRISKPVGVEEGYHNIFLNYRQGQRADGYGCDSLSARSLGPVDHGQPGLPVSQNLQNFDEGNKYYAGEDEKEFCSTRLAFYYDPVGRRHKFGSNDIPMYSVWIDKKGLEHQIDLVTSRQFYCGFYERYARQQPAYLELVRMLKQGWNLRICSLDAEPFESLDEIEKAYLDPKIAFGPARILCVMFTIPKEQYPWVKFKTFEF